MTTRHRPRLAALLVLAACASTPPPVEHDGADVERALWTRVSEDRAVQRVRQLAALGPRMGGTASGDRATDWLLRQFGAHGLPADVVEDPEQWVHAEHGWRLVAEATTGERLELERAWPYGYSPASSGRAPLVAEPTEGAALLLEGLGDARRSEREDAPLILLDGRPTEDGRYPKVGDLRGPIPAPTPVFGLAADESAWLRERLAGGVTIEWELDATVERASPRTVVARIPAADGAPPGYFLFCAHGDSDAGGPGANDNGSGEAIVLEIASAWATALRAEAVPLPPRELRFAIWGKEIHSTRHYLERALEAGHEILGVLNYDQSGFGSTLDLLYVEPDDLPANESLVRTIVEVLEDYAGTPGFPERWATNGSQGGTDSYVFSSAPSFVAESRPAVTLYASAWDAPGDIARTPGMPGESWNDGDRVHVDHDVYYHSAGDTPENTTDREPFNMGWNARVGLIASLRWLARLE